MRKGFTVFLLVALLGFGTNFAQTVSVGDTLIIDGGLGTLNEAIIGDVDGSGNRIHSVYKLKLGTQYLVTATINIAESVELVAPTPGNTKETRPPIVRGGLDESGTFIDLMLNVNAETWKAKNIWFSGINPSGDGGSWRHIDFNKDYGRFEWENCIFETPVSGWDFIRGLGNHEDWIFTDCKFRNVQRSGSTWSGQLLNITLCDTLKFVNCTIYNLGWLNNESGTYGNFYTEYDHCTFVNTSVHQFIMNQPIIAKVTNNLLINCHGWADGPVEISAHPDQEPHGIIHQFFMPDISQVDSMWNIRADGPKYDPDGDGTLTESERAYALKNNNWFYTQPITDYWAAFDSLTPNPWMCNATKEFFVNNLVEKQFEIIGVLGNPDTTWTYAPHPLYVEESTYNENPDFTNLANDDEFAANLAKMRETETAEGLPYYYNGEGVDPADPNSNLIFPWPLPEDFTYSNATLLAASQGGFPLGDLNWYLDKKAEWEDWVTTDIEDSKTGTLPTAFSLNQNYPNPFNPVTSISYTLTKNSHVELKVFNVLGAEVATLVNGQKIAGKYDVKFNASKLSSGVYFYQLTSADQTITRKMMLLK